MVCHMIQILGILYWVGMMILLLMHFEPYSQHETLCLFHDTGATRESTFREREVLRSHRLTYPISSRWGPSPLLCGCGRQTIVTDLLCLRCQATGVMEMRQALEDKEDAKSLKQKTRERVRPKMGKLTIDYQKLHDAFFKWQTKPKMTIHGDLYYEVESVGLVAAGLWCSAFSSLN